MSGFWKVVEAVSAVGEFYKDINPSTLSGAIDVVVVEKDNILSCSPFHVRFGKLKLLRPQEKMVEVSVNGKIVDLLMKVGEAGEAFFVVETHAHVPSEYVTSPIVNATVGQDVEPLILEDGKSPINVPSTDSHDSNLLDVRIHSVKDSGKYHHVRSVSADIKLTEDDTDIKNYPFSDTEIDSPRISKANSMKNIIDDNDGNLTDGIVPMIPMHREYSWKWGGLPSPLLETAPESVNWSVDIEKNQNEITPDVLIPIDSTTKENTKLENPEIIPQELHGLHISGIQENNSLAPGISSWGEITSNNSVFVKSESISSCPALEVVPDENSNDYKFPLDIEMSLCGIKEIKLSNDIENDLIFQKHKITYERFNESPNAFMTDPNIVFKIDNQYYPWSIASPIIVSILLFKKPLDSNGMKKVLPVTSSESKAYFSSIRNWWSKPQKSTEANSINPDSVEKKNSTEDPPKISINYNYAKSLRLTSDQLKSLDLKNGSNTVTFKVKSRLQGTATCTSKIFLWPHDTKIVISDVDGTITKSDVLGHMFTMVGRDWTQSGVASLYTNIRNNGYQLLYLTSRAIGQSSSTRDYLQKVEQGSHQLPEGPIIMSPDRLFKSFHREVILRRPEEFKMACLRDIKKLFGDKSTPFYAGFGNRITDALSYRSVDIPSSRIFTVDPSGELKLELISQFKSTYVKLNDIVDQIFPHASTLTDYSDFNFWRAPMESISLNIEPVESSEEIDGYAEDDESYESEES